MVNSGDQDRLTGTGGQLRTRIGRPRASASGLAWQRQNRGPQQMDEADRVADLRDDVDRVAGLSVVLAGALSVINARGLRSGDQVTRSSLGRVAGGRRRSQQRSSRAQSSRNRTSSSAAPVYDAGVIAPRRAATSSGRPRPATNARRSSPVIRRPRVSSLSRSYGSSTPATPAARIADWTASPSTSQLASRSRAIAAASTSSPASPRRTLSIASSE